MVWYMGIDIGSGSSKGVITQDGSCQACLSVPSGVNYTRAAEQLREGLLSQRGLSWKDIVYTTATGQGCNCVVYADDRAADLRCCARGINRLFPDVGTVIDIEGQSTQVIRLSPAGQVIDFAVSEKCASGSGRFLDVIANVLQVELKDIAALSVKSRNPLVFTTGCAVFGESEAISRVAEGALKEDILAGVIQSLADKVAELAARVGLKEKGAVCGGGALNAALVAKVENNLGVRLVVPDQPQLVNALGAAVISEEKYKQRSE